MDRVTADESFKTEILSRWQDFELSGAMLNDWLNLFTRFEPDEIKRAAAQYMLNYDSYKKPQLSKFKDILNAIAAGNFTKKPSYLDNYPYYFLQCTSDDSADWQYGTFTQIYPVADNPDLAMTIMQQEKKRYERMYGGVFIVVVCNSRSDVSALIIDRASKRKLTGVHNGLFSKKPN